MTTLSDLEAREALKANSPWAKIEPRLVLLPESGCWIFMGALNSRGYGHVSNGARNSTVLAHRASYEHHKGPIPSGLFVCHECDIKCCVNPDHLYVGDRLDNARDAVERRRFAFGLKNGNGRLTPAVVSQIRGLLASGSPIREVALATAVNRCTIREIRHGNIHKF